MKDEVRIRERIDLLERMKTASETFRQRNGFNNIKEIEIAIKELKWVLE